MMPKQGDKAPAFSALDADGRKISLSDFKGKKVVLYFYSEAGSPTCTIESCNLRDHHRDLTDAGYVVIGVSPDTAKAQQKFRTKYNLPFALIADVGHSIIDKYGVWAKKKLFGHEYMGVLRTTFVISERGVIEKIFHKPKNKMHAEEIIAAAGH
ncbi:MAG TPA: thioredoxin-dependent thiol peroxidase [Chitinophagaceae bacterium]